MEGRYAAADPVEDGQGLAPVWAADLLAILDTGALHEACLAGPWSRKDDARSCLAGHFEDLKAFLEQAAADKVGILVVYT